MNRGINDSKDLPRDYLSAVYDEIALSEIKLKPTSTATMSSKSSSHNLQGQSTHVLLVFVGYLLVFVQIEEFCFLHVKFGVVYYLTKRG